MPDSARLVTREVLVVPEHRQAMAGGDLKRREGKGRGCGGVVTGGRKSVQSKYLINATSNNTFTSESRDNDQKEADS